AVDERVVPGEADRLPRDAHVEAALGRRRETGAQAEQRRLSRSVRAGDEQEVAALELEVESAEDALLAVALAEAARADQGLAHETASAITNAQKTTLMIPFIVKNAMSRRRRS